MSALLPLLVYCCCFSSIFCYRPDLCCKREEGIGVASRKKNGRNWCFGCSKSSEYLVDPVVRQLGYLFYYRTNIEELSEKVEKLRDARSSLKEKHTAEAWI